MVLSIPPTLPPRLTHLNSSRPSSSVRLSIVIPSLLFPSLFLWLLLADRHSNLPMFPPPSVFPFLRDSFSLFRPPRCRHTRRTRHSATFHSVLFGSARDTHAFSLQTSFRRTRSIYRARSAEKSIKESAETTFHRCSRSEPNPPPPHPSS